MRMDALAEALATSSAAASRRKYIYTIPTVQNPPRAIMPEPRRAELLRLSHNMACRVFEDDCYADLIWDGKRPPALYATSRTGGVIHIGLILGNRSRRHCGWVSSSLWAILSRMPALTPTPEARARADGAGGILLIAFRRTRAES